MPFTAVTYKYSVSLAICITQVNGKSKAGIYSNFKFIIVTVVFR